MSTRDLALLEVVLDPLRAPTDRRHPEGAVVEAAARHPSDLLRLFERHRLGPLWHDAVASSRPRLPRPLVEALEARRQAALAQHVLHQAALRRAADALDRAGIPYAVFKGAHLSPVLYESPAHRPAGDIDVLVPPDRLKPAGAALEGAGFHGVPRRELSHEVSLRGHHAELDLHWEPLRPGRTRVNLGPGILEAAVARADGVRVPDPVHALLLALVHPALTDHVTGQLIRAVDLDRWVRTQPCDWDAVVRLAKALGVGTAAWAMATWTRDWLATPFPPGVLEALAPGPWRRRYLRAWLQRDPAGLYAGHAWAVRGLFSLAQEDGVRDAARAVGTLVLRRRAWRRGA